MCGRVIPCACQPPSPSLVLYVAAWSHVSHSLPHHSRCSAVAVTPAATGRPCELLPGRWAAPASCPLGGGPPWAVGRPVGNRAFTHILLCASAAAHGITHVALLHYTMHSLCSCSHMESCAAAHSCLPALQRSSCNPWCILYTTYVMLVCYSMATILRLPGSYETQQPICWRWESRV